MTNNSLEILKTLSANPIIAAYLKETSYIGEGCLADAVMGAIAKDAMPEPSPFEVLVTDAVAKALSNSHITKRIVSIAEEAVGDELMAFDFSEQAEDAVKEVVDGLDLSSEAEDAVRDAIDGGSRQIERALESAISDAVSDFDLEPMVKDAVDQYIASVMDESMASKVVEAEIAKAVAKQWEAFLQQNFRLVPERIACNNTLVLGENVPVMVEESVTE